MWGTSVVPLAIRTPAVDVINLSLDKYFLYSDGIFYPQKRSCVCFRRRFFMLTPCCCLSDGAELNKVEIWPPFAQWHCQKIYFKKKVVSGLWGDQCLSVNPLLLFFLSLHSQIVKSESNFDLMCKKYLHAKILTPKKQIIFFSCEPTNILLLKWSMWQ